jgi:hypothetical protein
MSKLQEKPSALIREHPALQNMKFLNFFLFLWVIFALLDPDPDYESGSNPDQETLLARLVIFHLLASTVSPMLVL